MTCSAVGGAGAAGGFTTNRIRPGAVVSAFASVAGTSGGTVVVLRRTARLPGGTTVITLTDSAASKVNELITAEGENGLALRVAVRPGGCSGFSYEMYFDTDKATDDITEAFSGVDVVVDPQSAMLLEGATLDYKDGLQDAGFSIDNPNAQRTCGCGQSFS